MRQAYKDYIESNHATYELCYGKCDEATRVMQCQFPELKRVCGHVETMGWGRRAHWWLVAEDGEVVDPTVKQFPGVFRYEEFKPGTEVQVGRCMECGEEIWRAVDSLDEIKRESICSEQCADAFERSFR